VARSHEIWEELADQTGQQLFYQSGGYIITPPDSVQTQYDHWYQFVNRTAEVATGAGIPFELQDAEQVRKDLPNVIVRDGDQIGYEPSGGIVLSEKAVEAQLKLAQKQGAAVKFNEPVKDIQFSTDSVTVVTEAGHYTADKAIVTTGPWTPSFLPEQEKSLLRVTRQVVYWFEVEDLAAFSTDNFAFFLWVGDQQEDYIGVFPIPPNGIPGMKLLTEQFVEMTDPDTVTREVTQAEIAHFYERYVTRHFTGVTPNCLKASVCLYTSTPDEHFIIDHHPESERIVVTSACSSHGFKHSAAIGEAVVQLAMTGRSDIDLGSFRWDRFRNNG